MNVPSTLRDVDGRGASIRTYEYDDGDVIAVDFGPSASVTVDVVGDTAIVVAGERHFEFELPAEARDVTSNNGVITISE